MKSILTWLGQPIVDVDGDKAKPVEGVTAHQLADVLAWQWREIVRLRAKHHRDMRTLFGPGQDHLSEITGDVPWKEIGDGPYTYEPTTKMPETR